jgi:hypothetical protein
MVKLHALKNINPFIITALTALAAFLVLFAFRSADSNRLFNWQWVLTRDNITSIFLFLTLGMIAAYLLARAAIFERRPAAFLFLFSFVSAALLWTEPELIIDASRYFTQAKHLEVYGIKYFMREWGRDITAWTDLPTVPFLYGLIFTLFGENRIIIQALTTLMFSTTVVLTYLIGKTLWTEELGFFAGMLLLGMPVLLTQVPLMLVDVPTMFFLTLTIYTFMKTINRGGVGMISLSSIALCLTAFSKYSTWILLSVLGIIVAVYWKRNPGTTLRRSFVVLILSIVLIGIAVALKFDVFSEQIRLLLSYQKPGLQRWGESLLSTFFIHIHPFITLAAIYSIVVAFEKRDLNYGIIGWMLMLVLAFDIKRSRYLLPVLPMLALTASYGFQKIKRRDLRRFVVFVIVISSLITTVFAYLPFARRTSAENLKNAGEYLNSLDIETVEVITLPLRDPVANPSVAVPILDLFTQKSIRYQYHKELYQSPSNIETWALRFTWGFKNPQYYLIAGTSKTAAVIAIISGELVSVLPHSIKQRIEGYRLSGRFAASSDPFRYKTIVEIYTKQLNL